MAYSRSIAVFFILLTVFSSGCTDSNTGVREYTSTRDMMGTYVTVTVESSEPLDEDIINKTFTAMQASSDILSHYSKTNRLYELNTNGFGRSVQVEPELYHMIEESILYSQMTGGAFDVTVQPLLDLWEQAATGKIPTNDEVVAAKDLTGYEDIILAPEYTVGYAKPGMKVTLGGIAKGRVIDAGIEYLKSNGVEHALVNAGGDMRAIGARADGTPWRVALRNPRDETEYVTIINLAGNSVATSGDYERYYTPDKKAHHILDPRTGYSATELISVTIITDNATHADALATGVFVLGPVEGMKLVEELDDVEALVITDNRTIIKSSGFDRAARA